MQLGTYYALYDTGTLHATTFNYQKQNRWAYEARLTSQGDSKLQWMAGAFYEDVYDWWEYGDADARRSTDHGGMGTARTTNACDAIADPGRRLPARPDRHLLLQQVPTTRCSSSPSSAR